jgi:hypothetical protein
MGLATLASEAADGAAGALLDEHPVIVRVGITQSAKSAPSVRLMGIAYQTIVANVCVGSGGAAQAGKRTGASCRGWTPRLQARAQAR